MHTHVTCMYMYDDCALAYVKMRRGIWIIKSDVWEAHWSCHRAVQRDSDVDESIHQVRQLRPESDITGAISKSTTSAS